MKATISTEKPVASSTLISPRPHSEVRSLTQQLLRLLLARKTLWVLVLVPLGIVLYKVAVYFDSPLPGLLLRHSPLLLLSVAAAGGLWFGERWRTGVDQQLFSEQYQQEHLLLTLLEQIAGCADVSEVVYHTSQVLHEAYQATPIHFFFRAEGSRDLKLVYSYGGATKIMLIPEEARLRSWLKREGRTLDYHAHPDLHLPPQELRWLETLQAHLLVPMPGKDRRLLGVIMLGKQRSGHSYSAHDYALLDALAAEVARRIEWEEIRVQTLQHSHAPLTALARLEAEMKRQKATETNSISPAPSRGMTPALPLEQQQSAPPQHDTSAEKPTQI